MHAATRIALAALLVLVSASEVTAQSRHRAAQRGGAPPAGVWGQGTSDRKRWRTQCQRRRPTIPSKKEPPKNAKATTATTNIVSMLSSHENTSWPNAISGNTVPILKN